jgi:hypothetical protein
MPEDREFKPGFDWGMLRMMSPRNRGTAFFEGRVLLCLGRRKGAHVFFPGLKKRKKKK